MLVTCCVTKEKIEKELAFSVPQDSGRNKYYKNKELYQNELDKVNFYADLKEFSGLRGSDKVPVEVFSYYSNLTQSYSWVELYKALLFKKDDIRECRNKPFNSTGNKLLYIAKIVESGLVINQMYSIPSVEIPIDIDAFNDIVSASSIINKKRSVLQNWKKGI